MADCRGDKGAPHRPPFSNLVFERRSRIAAAKTWLLAQIQKKRAAPPTDIMEAAPNRFFPSERLAA
jgi:hypothetical protein